MSDTSVKTQPVPLGKALSALLADVGLPREATASRVSVVGDDPAIDSPHRLAGAAATAIAAQSAAVAALWEMRGGQAQTVSVDVRRAAHAINPSRYLKQNAYPIGFAFTYEEPGNGYFRTADGRFIFLVSTRPGLRNGLLKVLDCANTPEAIAAAVRRWDSEALETICAEQELAGAVVRSPDEWRATSHGASLLRQPVVAVRRIKDGPPQPFGPGERPLSGLRVLDVSHVLAGPGLTRTMAEQGAEVLRISAPRQTDPINFMLDTGFGKRSAFLDLAAPGDIERLFGLAREADVVVQSYAPGSLARRGVTRERLMQGHPGLIYVSLSCYGDTGGPWSMRAGFDHNAQAATGISAVEGGMDSPRLPRTTLVADYITAYLGTLGALAGLIARAQHGGSYEVSVSLARTCMWVQDLGLLPGPWDRIETLDPVTGRMDGPFGELEYLLPVTEFSETRAHWTSPPLPFGASPAVWSPRG